MMKDGDVAEAKLLEKYTTKYGKKAKIIGYTAAGLPILAGASIAYGGVRHFQNKKRYKKEK